MSSFNKGVFFLIVFLIFFIFETPIVKVNAQTPSLSVLAETVYGLTPTKDAVFKWTGQGTQWTKIGGPADKIVANRDSVYATNPTTGDTYAYNLIPNT
jgi:hypothetical protein